MVIIWANGLITNNFTLLFIDVLLFKRLFKIFNDLFFFLSIIIVNFVRISKTVINFDEFGTISCRSKAFRLARDKSGMALMLCLAFESKFGEVHLRLAIIIGRWYFMLDHNNLNEFKYELYNDVDKVQKFWCTYEIRQWEE